MSRMYPGGFEDNGFQISESKYWELEAQLGARWAREDGKDCPCGGGGYLLSNIDVWVRCDCPLPEPDWASSTVLDFFADQSKPRHYDVAEGMELFSVARVCCVVDGKRFDGFRFSVQTCDDVYGWQTYTEFRTLEESKPYFNRLVDGRPYTYTVD